MRRALLIAVLAGIVVGTCLAGLPYAENGLCQRDRFGTTEGYTTSSSLGLWPLGTTCRHSAPLPPPIQATTTIEHRGGAGEGLAWVALAALLFAASLLRPSAAARGASCAAALLAFVGFGWHFGGELVAAGMFAVSFGALLVFAVDRALRPPGARTFLGSAAATVAVTPATLFGWALGFFPGYAYLGVAAGLLAGAAAAAAVERLGRPFARPAVAR